LEFWRHRHTNILDELVSELAGKASQRLRFLQRQLEGLGIAAGWRRVALKLIL
jgi:hypothetical protein